MTELVDGSVDIVVALNERKPGGVTGIVREFCCANLVFVVTAVGDKLSASNRFGRCPFGLITSTVGCFEFDEFRRRLCNGTCIPVPFIDDPLSERPPFVMSILWCSGCIRILSSIYVGPPFDQTFFKGLATIGISDGGGTRDRGSLFIRVLMVLMPISSTSEPDECNFGIVSIEILSPEWVDSITGTKVSVLVSMFPCHNDCSSEANECIGEVSGA